jgi:hypothetical protein
MALNGSLHLQAGAMVTVKKVLRLEEPRDNAGAAVREATIGKRIRTDRHPLWTTFPTVQQA